VSECGKRQSKICFTPAPLQNSTYNTTVFFKRFADMAEIINSGPAVLGTNLRFSREVIVNSLEHDHSVHGGSILSPENSSPSEQLASAPWSAPTWLSNLCQILKLNLRQSIDPSEKISLSPEALPVVSTCGSQQTQQTKLPTSEETTKLGLTSPTASM
jgi:hypothetical protein